MHAKRTKKTQLDPYEKDLEASFEQTEQLSSEEEKRAVELLKQAASNYMKKNKRVTIRVYDNDLTRIKMMAIEEGLPYQTLITSILHKFATGRLKNKGVGS